MKKLSTLTVFFFFTSLISAQDDSVEEHHCYFKKNSISFGLGPTYSFGLESVGINSRIYYNIGERLCFGPEISYLKKHDESVTDIDFIGHYIFEIPWFGLYPLVGINYTKEI